MPMSMTIWQCHPCLRPKRKDCEHDPGRVLGSKPFPYPWQWARHDQPLQVRPCRFLNSKMQNPKSLLHLVMWLTWQAKEHTFCSKNTKKEGHSRVDQMIHIMLQILPLVQCIAILRFLHETCAHLSSVVPRHHCEAWALWRFAWHLYRIVVPQQHRCLRVESHY